MPNYVWRLPLTAGANWEWLPLPSAPTDRFSHTATFDPIRGRMILIGGNDGSPRNDVYALSLGASPAWTRLHPLGTPPLARYGHSAVYDPVRDRILVFGGRISDIQTKNDVWALNLGTAPAWEMLTPATPQPAARDNHVAFYDPVADAMIVFGGRGNSIPEFGDTWKLSLSGTPTWSPIVTSGVAPTARYGACGVYDPVSHRALLFGGRNSTGALSAELWALSLDPAATWTRLTPAGPSPARRYYSSMFVDPTGSRLVIYGGMGSSATLANGTYVTLGTAPTWEPFAPTYLPPTSPRAVAVAAAATPGPVTAVNNSPWAMYGSSMIFDPVRDRMILYGGSNFNSWVWTLALSPLDTAWVSQGNAPIPGRYGHTSIYDPVRDRMIVFGGYNGNYLRDLSELRLGGTPAWYSLPAANMYPSARDYHAAVYDPVRDRMLLFGGNRDGSYFNDLWALELSGTPRWTQLSASGTPPTRRLSHAMTYDSVRDRVILTDGYDTGENWETYELTLSPRLEWRLLNLGSSVPVGRHSHSVVYDPAADRMLLFGGVNMGSRKDLWSLSLAAPEGWTQFAISGDWPEERHGHAAAFDYERRMMVVFGGYTTRTGTNWGDTWILHLGGFPTPVLASVSRADVAPDRVMLTWFASRPPSDVCAVMRREGSGAWRELARLAFDGTGRLSFEDRDVSPGARYTYGLLAAGETEPSALYEVEVPRGATLSLAGLARNPSLSSLAIRFSLADATPARLEVMDVAGRTVFRDEVGSLGAGSHVIDAGRAAPGIYWIRLTHGNEVLTARGAVVR